MNHKFSLFSLTICFLTRTQDEKSYMGWMHFRLLDVAMRAWIYYQQNYVNTHLLPTGISASASANTNSSKGK